LTIEKSSGGVLVHTARFHGMGVVQASRSEADLETLRPRTSQYRHTLIGETKTTYDGKQARTEITGKEAKTADLTPTTVDNEAAYALMRRLPLAPDYKGTIEVVSPLGGAVVKIETVVRAVEDVVTPAGTFRAYKLDLEPLKQSFWISADAHRYIVKFEAGGVCAELLAVRQIGRSSTTFNDPAGLSLALPPEWIADKTTDAKSDFTVPLYDPQGRCTGCWFWVGKFDHDVRAELDKKIAERQKKLKDYVVRPESWQARQIKGRDAASLIADFTSEGRKMVEYMIAIKGAGTDPVFVARTGAAEFELLRPQIDAIADSAETK
jgi:hypothetical protein